MVIKVNSVNLLDRLLWITLPRLAHYTPLSYCMHPLHHSLSHYFCLRNWLDLLPHLHPTLSPSPSSLIQSAPEGWPDVLPCEGKGCGVWIVLTLHWHPDTLTLLRAQAPFTQRASWNPAGYCVTGSHSERWAFLCFPVFSFTRSYPLMWYLQQNLAFRNLSRLYSKHFFFEVSFNVIVMACSHQDSI